MPQLNLTVNGRAMVVDAEPSTLLVDLLRGPLALTGTHQGCDTGQCGACTVLVDGQSVKACSMLAVQAAGCAVTTVEGLGEAAPDGVGDESPDDETRHAGWIRFGAVPLPLTPPPTALVSGHCGSCTACIEVCPTQAIVAPYRLDARRCISYLTIEHDGPIPVELRRGIGQLVAAASKPTDAGRVWAWASEQLGMPGIEIDHLDEESLAEARRFVSETAARKATYRKTEALHHGHRVTEHGEQSSPEHARLVARILGHAEALAGLREATVDEVMRAELRPDAAANLGGLALADLTGIEAALAGTLREESAP